MLAPVSAFATLYALGYTRLVPVIPPNAEISEGSSLYKRIGTKQDARGKVPGVKGQNGRWFSYDWVPLDPDEADLTRWAGMGAGAGIKTGHGLYAIDADTLDETSAAIIRDAVKSHFGQTPVRVGNFPKALYLIRVPEDMPYTRIEFGPLDDAGKPTERCEILGDRRFFVAAGTHPKTKQPYHWPSDLTPFDDLPQATHEQVEAFLDDIRQHLPNALMPKTEGDGNDVNQETLRGDPTSVRQAVEATPNTSKHFPTRESYLQMGYAIKAALPDDEHEALEIYSDWCDRWAEGNNDPDVIQADWSRMHPPFRMGASWLYEQAERTGHFDQATVHFKPVDRTLDPFDAQMERERQEDTSDARTPLTASPFTFLDPSTLPKRQWLYGTHYIRKFVSATVAPSGVGKSSLTIVEALSMASNRPLLDQPTHKGPHRVWLWNGEDPRDELQRRITAAMLQHKITPEDIEDRLFVDTGREQEIILAVEARHGAQIATPRVAEVIENITRNKIDVLTIDPFVSSHRVPENDNNAIDLVTKQWAAIADKCNCSIELVHHVRKTNGEETSVEDSRGAVALLATSRSARAITKMTAKEAEKIGLEDGAHLRYFRFSDAKNNLALPGDVGSDWMKMESVGLGNGEGDDDLSRLMDGDSVGVVCHEGRLDSAAEGWGGAMDAGEQGRIVAAVAEATKLGCNRLDFRAGEAWVGRYVARALGLDIDDKADRTKTRRSIEAAIATKLLQEVSRNDAKRMPRTFVEVNETYIGNENEAFG